MRIDVALGLALALALPSAVSAQQTPAADAAPTAEQLEQARALFVAGSQAYREEKYRVAIEAFESAFVLAPRASLVFALAQANRLQYFIDGEFEHLENAVGFYRRYLARDDTDPSQEAVAVRHLASLTSQLNDLKRQRDVSVGRIIVSSDTPEARVRVGDQPPLDVPAAFEVEPGPVQVTIEAPGHAPQVREVVAVGGDAVPIDVPLEPLPGQLEVRTDAGAEIRIDGRSLGIAPLPTQQLRPGEHRVVILQSGRVPSVSTVQVQHSQQTVLDVPLELSEQRIAAWGLFGVAALLAVTSGISGTLQWQAHQEADALYETWQVDGLDPEEVADYSARVSERDAWTQRTIWLGVGAGVAAGIGAALWLLDDPQPPNQPVLLPTVAPGGAGAGLSGQFAF